jgi:hypothetical protein
MAQVYIYDHKSLHLQRKTTYCTNTLIVNIQLLKFYTNILTSWNSQQELILQKIMKNT